VTDGTDVIGSGPPAALYADIRGSSDEAVVLLHGQPGSSGEWDSVAGLLEDRFLVITPDRPGYGRSDGPATGFAGNTAALITLLDRLGVPRALIVGHSWAGGAAIWAAAKHPGRVSGLVLVSSVGPGERLTWNDRLLAAPVAGEAVAAAADVALGLLAGSSRVRSFADRHLPSRARDAYSYIAGLNGAKSRPIHSFLLEQRHFLRDLGELEPLVAAINTVTVVLHGTADKTVEADVAVRLAAGIRKAELVWVPGAGHLLPQQHPSDVATAIRAVADRAAADRAAPRRRFGLDGQVPADCESGAEHPDQTADH
jgi:pimeloyl-ACP methyl ester carboxylesterase